MNETKTMYNFRKAIQSEPVRIFHYQLLQRLKLLEFITKNDILFKIDENIINSCADFIKMNATDVIKLINYYKKNKLFVKVNCNEENIYKIGDTFLEGDELKKRRSIIWSYKYSKNNKKKYEFNFNETNNWRKNMKSFNEILIELTEEIKRLNKEQRLSRNENKKLLGLLNELKHVKSDSSYPSYSIIYKRK